MTKAQFKTAAKAALTGARETIGSALSAMETETNRYLLAIAPFEIQAGIGCAIIRATFTDAKAAKVDLSKVSGIGTNDWREYAQASVPGKDVKTVYRWTNAGTVAAVLGPIVETDEDGTETVTRENLIPVGCLIGSLVPLYRILSAAKTADQKTAAESLVRETYSDCLAASGTKTDEDGTVTQVAPTFDEVKAAAEKAAPTNRSGGSDGSADSDAVESDDSETIGSDAASSSGLVQVDAAAVEACRANWRPMLASLVETHGVSAETVAAIGLAVLRFASLPETGIGTMQAVLTVAAVPAVPVETGTDAAA